MLAPIGDTLFATPAIHALRGKYPEAHISAIVYPTNQGILIGNPDIDEIFVHPILEQWRQSPDLLRLFWRMRRRHFDLAVDLCTFSLFLSRIACGISHRVKLQLPNLWWLLSYRHKAWAKTHAVYHYLSALEPLGITVAEPKLYLTLTEGDHSFAEDYLRQHGVENGDLLVAIHPGGEGFSGKKRWQREGFAEVGKALVERYNAKILILGSRDERRIAHGMARLMDYNCINGAGETTLRQTAALIERCQLFIGNDSSPLHIATALKVPVVGIYGPSNTDNFHPFGENWTMVRSRFHCAPCFHFIGSTPFWQRPLCRTPACLQDIRPSEVVEAAERMLALRKDFQASPLSAPSPLEPIR